MSDKKGGMIAFLPGRADTDLGVTRFVAVIKVPAELPANSPLNLLRPVTGEEYHCNGAVTP